MNLETEARYTELADKMVGSLWREYRALFFDTNLEEFRTEVMTPASIVEKAESEDADFRRWLVENMEALQARWQDDDEALAHAMELGEAGVPNIDLNLFGLDTLAEVFENVIMFEEPELAKAMANAMDKVALGYNPNSRGTVFSR